MADLIHFDKALAGIVDQIDHVTDAELMEVGHFATALVIARTKKGLDADGKPFAPYSDSYTEERAKHGLPATPVDLARSGHMLGAMNPQQTGPDEVSVLFSNPLEATKAAAHNYGVGSQRPSGLVKRAIRSVRRALGLSNAFEPKREFLDVRLPAELDAIAEVIGSAIAGRVEKSIG